MKQPKTRYTKTSWNYPVRFIIYLMSVYGAYLVRKEDKDLENIINEQRKS